jgi:3-dehydroshikimate dehydratase
MIRSGLVSITFRSYTAEQIITLMCRMGLEGVEWGGDVHVPHGDIKKAVEVGQATRDAGLTVASYGSYYRAGFSAAEGMNFRSVLETAEALGAKTIRVWAGGAGSAQADAKRRANVVADLQRITALAEGSDIEIALEHHSDTLTDQADSALNLLRSVGAGNLRLNWQPQFDTNLAEREESLGLFLPHLSHVHVFYWNCDGQRQPLEKGLEEWRRYLDIVHGTGRDHFAMIEFVRNDSPEQLHADVETLKNLLAS